jgi:hypothetical protein
MRAILDIQLEDVVILQSLPATEKLSYHLVFKDIILKSPKESEHLCKYIKSQLYDIPVLSNDEVVDGRIYTKNRAMRLLNQSKIDKEATLQCISGHKKYDKLGLTCIYERELQEDEFFEVEPYIQEVNKAKTTKSKKTRKTTTKKNTTKKETKTERIELNKPERDRRQLLRDVVEKDCLTKEEIEIYEKIMGLINRDYLRNYQTASYICFSLGSMGNKLYNMCDNLMKRADDNLKKEEKEKYGKEWVKGLFDKNKQNFYEDPLNGRHMTIDYALAIAKQSDVKNYNIYMKELEKLTKNNLQLEEEFNIDEDIRNTIYPTNLEEKEDEITVNEYEAEFVEPYPYNDYDIMVMRSRMGSGKTTAMKKCLDDYRPKSVLFFSCRIIYSYNMMGEFKEYNIENYKDLKSDLNDVDKLFCSLESIHRLDDENCYDLIILDEIETILNTFSGGTVASKEFEIKETFFEILKNGNKIIANDAFLSDRGVNFYSL